MHNQKLLAPTAEQLSPTAPLPSLGKDELNLAEFPLSLDCKTPGPTQTHLVREDTVYDTASNKRIARKVTVTPGEGIGLPTPTDEDVLLSLIQLTFRAGLTARRVAFTLSGLLRIMGWTLTTQNYRRLRKSLHRWKHVTITYERAWWKRETACWVDETFSVIDNASIVRREGPTSTRDTSYFVWNEVLFKSFQSGNCKPLDMPLYNQLKTPVTKRLYRFLDKRFYQRPTWDFELQEFAGTHIGLALNYKTANLKRKLAAALTELEQVGCLQKSDEANRYRKTAPGVWRIYLAKAAITTTTNNPSDSSVPTAAEELPKQTANEPPNTDEQQAVLTTLLAMNVTPAIAEDLVAHFPLEAIKKQIAVTQWLAGNQTHQPRNSAGYVITSIRNDYPLPPAYVKAMSHRTAKIQQQTTHKQTQDARRIKAEAQELQNQTRITHFRESLSPAEKAAHENHALAHLSSVERDLQLSDSVLWPLTRDHYLATHALAQLAQANPPAPQTDPDDAAQKLLF